METIYFVMPAYNEEMNIEEVIRQWHPICEQIYIEGNAAKLVIANDGSKDKTFDIIQSLQSKYPYLKPLNKENSGHGATVLYCIVMLSTTMQIIFSKQTAMDRLYRKSFGKCGEIAITMTSKSVHEKTGKMARAVSL